jgi:hypothetical protein
MLHLALGDERFCLGPYMTLHLETDNIVGNLSYPPTHLDSNIPLICFFGKEFIEK